MAKPWVCCPGGIFSSSLQVPSWLCFVRELKKPNSIFSAGRASCMGIKLNFVLYLLLSKLCLMRLLLCQPHLWETISESTALCQGVMDGTESWTMLAIPRPMGWQERWDTHILGCKWDLGRPGAGKNSVLCVGVPATIAPVSNASRGWKHWGQTETGS